MRLPRIDQESTRSSTQLRPNWLGGIDIRSSSLHWKMPALAHKIGQIHITMLKSPSFLTSIRRRVVVLSALRDFARSAER